MMKDTVTLDDVDIGSSLLESNEKVVFDPNPGYAISGLRQTRLPIWRGKRSGIRIQPARNLGTFYARDWDGPAEHAETYVVMETPNGLVVVPTSDSVVEKVDKELQQWAYAKQYATRLDSLRTEAENEEIEINENSLSDFWKFLAYAAPKTYGSVMLSPRGTCRAVWRTGPDNHIGLHFTGSGMVNYVIFKSKPNDDEIAREAGTCSFIDVLSLIERYGLTSLV